MPNLSAFEEFQLSEYRTIATSHFETVKQISIFYRYYLLIVSAPSILLILGKGSLNYFSTILASDSPKEVNFFIGFFLIVVSLVGILICLYLINLRCDAVLYARTVNGVRKYFYDESLLEKSSEDQYRILPIMTNLPKYFEGQMFYPVILTFGIINSAYFGLGSYIISIRGSDIFNDFPILFKNYNLTTVIIVMLILFFSHILLYWLSTRRRTNLYLKSKIIGVDIDGVLNDHRKKFCEVLLKLTGKQLKPNEITTIPVRHIPDKDIKKIDEYLVFNTLQYWTDMYPIEDDFIDLENISNIFGYRVYIFSHRSWPDFRIIEAEVNSGNIDKNDKSKYREFIFDAKKEWAIKIKIFKITLCLGPIFRSKRINIITRKWLRDRKIKYKKLVLEKGNTDSISFSSKVWRKQRRRFMNRYYFSHRNAIRYFVEDNLENAIKLSRFCEYVFLVRNSYNIGGQLPRNVIRVENWKEIVDYIKRFG